MPSRFSACPSVTSRGALPMRDSVLKRNLAAVAFLEGGGAHVGEPRADVAAGKLRHLPEFQGVAFAGRAGELEDDAPARRFDRPCPAGLAEREVVARAVRRHRDAGRPRPAPQEPSARHRADEGEARSACELSWSRLRFAADLNDKARSPSMRRSNARPARDGLQARPSGDRAMRHNRAAAASASACRQRLADTERGSHEHRSQAAELGVTLPTPAAPIANYVPLRAHRLRSWSRASSASASDGKLAASTRASSAAKFRPRPPARRARLCAINILAQAKAALGSLDAIKRCVRLGGFINAVPDLSPAIAPVMNGASDFMVAALGDKGRHARTTIGVAELPLDAVVEVEAMFEVAVNGGPRLAHRPAHRASRPA